MQDGLGGSDSTRLPAISFDSNAVDLADAFDAMSAFSSGLYAYSGYQGLQDAPYLRLQAWSLGVVAAASFSHSALVAAATKVAPEFEDQIVLRMVRKGQVPVQSGEMADVMVPGRLYILHPQNTLTPTEAGQSLALRFPMGAVGYDPSRHGRILSFPEDDHIGRVLSSAMKTLFETLPQMARADAGLSGEMMCALMRNLLSRAPMEDNTRQGWRAAQDAAMQRYLLDNLRNPQLGIAHLQARFGASRATVYRAFEAQGGVASYIRRERMVAIDRELRHCCPRYGCIRQISERYGFVDQSAFVKSFKRERGVRPSEVIGINAGHGTPVQVSQDALSVSLPRLAHFWSANRGIAA